MTAINATVPWYAGEILKATNQTKGGASAVFEEAAAAYTLILADRKFTESATRTTRTDQESPRGVESVPISAERIYPHVFDGDLPAGKALVHIGSAMSYARSALDAFAQPDLEAVRSYLAQIAAAMSGAYPKTEFNESLGGVVGFLRRAVLIADTGELTRSALNALSSALRSISENPMLDLDDAADIVELLEKEGWRGGHSLADEIIQLLLGEDEGDRQMLLHLETHAEA
jgi:hypothetical protein